MSESLIQFLSGAGLFILGVVVGVIMQRSFMGSAEKGRRLEQKLAEAQEEYERYQADVSAHFMETAKLVRTLNRSYRDVHAQLVKGATRLCDSDQAEEFVGLSFDGGKRSKRTIESEDEGRIVPPMDYAPKVGPEDEGTLSERYGLKSKRKDTDDLLDDDIPPRI